MYCLEENPYVIEKPECLAQSFNSVDDICVGCNFAVELEDDILDSECIKLEEEIEEVKLMKPGEATEVVKAEIKHLEFENIEVPFEYENCDGEWFVIDKDGVNRHHFSYTDLPKYPTDDGFEEWFENAIGILRDNISLLAIWLLNRNSICSL